MQSARQKFYNIGKAAKFLGVSSETLRRWDRQGKIRIGRTPAGYRVFSEHELEELKQFLQPQDSFNTKPYTTLHMPRIAIPKINFPRVKLPKVSSRALVISFFVLIFVISNAVTVYTLTTFTPLPNILSREAGLRYKVLSENVTAGRQLFSSFVNSSIKETAKVALVTHEKSVLGIETALIPAAQEGSALAQTYLTRIVSFFKSISFPSFRFPFLAFFVDNPETEIVLQEDLTLRIEALEEAIVALGESSSVSQSIGDSLILSSLTAVTINTNTFDGSKLIFSGSSPSIYPSTKDTTISLNASGTGAINIGNAGTGDIYLGGGSGDSGCTLTNNNGTFNCSSNITTGGDLIANGGDILTDKATLTLGNSSQTVSIPGTLAASGQVILTRPTTKVHTGTWAINSSTWNADASSLYINAASAVGDSNILGLAVAGGVKFTVDAEGDIFGGNLVLTGNTTSGTTTVAGTLTVEGNTVLGDNSTDTITFTGTVASLTVTGNINSSTGALQTNGVTRIDNSGNLTAGTGAFSGTVTIGGGTGKIDVGTVDPPFTIAGGKYATYLSGMTGVKEGTVGIVRLQNGKYEIEFTKEPRGSDLWLFYQVSYFGDNWENLTAQLTPNFSGRVWYTKDSKNRKLTIYGSASGEVSYHFIAPRFDYLSWPNTRESGSEGFILGEKK